MAQKTKLLSLQNFNLFNGMSPKLMEKIDSMAQLRSTKKKEIIFFPDEASETVYFLKEGKIKISRVSESGKTTTLQLPGPCELFGVSSLPGQEKQETKKQNTCSADCTRFLHYLQESFEQGY